MAHKNAMRFVTRFDLGILGQPDNEDMWTEILSKVPDEALLKPNVKILCVACGHGTEAKILFKRMLALGIPRDKVQQSIWVIDKYKWFGDSIRLSSGITNVFAEDFLSWQPNMKFDVIVSNPPYQKPANVVKDKHKRAGGLWWEFVKTFDALLNDGGHIAVVCPNSLFGAGYLGTKSFKLKNLLKNLKFTHVWPNVSQHFSVGITILAFVCNKTKDMIKTEIVGSNDLLEIDPEFPAPYYFTGIGYQIAKKTLNVKDPVIEFHASVSAKPNQAVLTVNGGRFKQWHKTFVGYARENPNTQQGAIIPEAHIPGYQSALKSDIWEYLFLVYGAAAGQSPNYMGYFPTMPDMTREYTNDEWYQAFGITPEEQAHVREYLKR